MARYVDVKKAIKAVENMCDCYNGFSDTYDKAAIIGLLEEVPTADVAPVIHAKWIKGRYCSNCECDDYDYCCRQPKYCPECGAKMGEEYNDKRRSDGVFRN